jgi:uncharacterized repeat protein (TIGR03803 family)
MRQKQGGEARLSLWKMACAVCILGATAAIASPAQTFSVLYSFRGQPDGAQPTASVIADSAGNLYGMTEQGGAYGYGAVFELKATGRETVLYSFKGKSDGGYPFYGSLLLDGAGNLYGTTAAGGLFNSICPPEGCGVVFKLSPTGRERALYSFTGGSDGYRPASSLIFDAAGNLYGTTAYGGADSSCVDPDGFYGCGVVFELSPSGVETVLHSFTGADGWNPVSGLIRDHAGNLYGTTEAGGDLSACGGGGCGVVFKLDPTGVETVLYSFTGGSDGETPFPGVVQDPAGNLYGTTEAGGDLSACGGGGCGVVFKVDPTGNETVLHTFSGADGEFPIGVVRVASGNLYGTTDGGGSNGFGAIFKVSPAGVETLLYSLTNSDGIDPEAGLLPYKGYLYGTTSGGGTANNGVVFKLSP